MPVLFGFRSKNRSNAVNLSTGFCTSKYKFFLSNPVVMTNGFCNAKREIISSFTSLVAVAVKAPIIGRLGID